MKKALIILSGGQDSTTCLYWAKNRFDKIYTITFDYAQRHSIEILSAGIISDFAKVYKHELIKIPNILVGTSPLVNKNIEVEQYNSVKDLPGGVEPTFVPGRNILFLTIAANRAFCLGIKDIVMGLCQEDFGGYYDCRKIFIDRMQEAIGEGVYGDKNSFIIHTPLMDFTKKEIVIMATTFNDCMEALTYSHTCYNGKFPPCGKCHACHLRIQGFAQAAIEDPLLKREKQ